MPSNEEVNKQADALEHYGAACRALKEALRWAQAGFPGATAEEILQIAGQGSRLQAYCERIRERVERNFKRMLRGQEPE